MKDGLSDPSMGTSDANTTGPFLDNFVSGKTGMIIMANWWESALKSGMGDKFADIAHGARFPSDRTATSRIRSPIRG